MQHFRKPGRTPSIRLRMFDLMAIIVCQQGASFGLKMLERELTLEQHDKSLERGRHLHVFEYDWVDSGSGTESAHDDIVIL